MPDAAERWLRRAERRLQQQRITVIASSSDNRGCWASRRRRLELTVAGEATEETAKGRTGVS
jgi:hypothetical protein